MTTPADIIARAVMCDLGCCTGEEPDGVDHMEAERIIAALDAAGFDIVARQPDTCPTCPTCKRKKPGYLREGWGQVKLCPDAWHDRGQR